MRNAIFLLAALREPNTCVDNKEKQTEGTEGATHKDQPACANVRVTRERIGDRPGCPEHRESEGKEDGSDRSKHRIPF